MGIHYSHTNFSEDEFKEFKKNLRKETATLLQLYENNYFTSQERIFGLEIETWILDAQGDPVAENDTIIQACHQKGLVPELSQFNLEINSSPLLLKGACLRDLHQELLTTTKAISDHIEPLGRRILLIGSYPHLEHKHLGLQTISKEPRYHHLNKQIMKLKKGRPSQVIIEGRDTINICHEDVMMEAAATSLQIHLQVPQDESVTFYNASIIASSIMVGVTANTPFLFGKSLWAESRIPLFEQSLALPCFHDVHGKTIERVTFGTGYARHSLMECFLENLNGFPVLIPIKFTPSEFFDHLRLHNGTIWRWNRPILGKDFQGQAAMRVEHRCPAASPSITDLVSDTAFYLGLVHVIAEELAKGKSPPEFSLVRDDFYRIAENGLQGPIHWFDGHSKKSLILFIEKELIPRAMEKLKNLGVESKDIDYYLGDIMIHRVKTQQNGTEWQREMRRKVSFQEMINIYSQNQSRDIPVSRWEI